MMSTTRLLALAALLACTVSAPGAAQSAASDAKPAIALASAVANADTAAAPSSEARVTPSGPVVDVASSGVRFAPARIDAASPDAAAATAAQRQRFTQSETLMIVGGVAFLAGAVIGGDAGTVIMIGGAAIGIYGLFLYLQ
jgi:hypothetical protein